MFPGWEPGERSCLHCGFESYARVLPEAIARAEVNALERVREGKFFFGRAGNGGVRSSR